MPLLEVKLRGSLFGNEVLNVFNYLATGTPASVSFSFGLVSALGAIDEAGVYPADTLIDLMRDLQTEDMIYTDIEVRDVYSVTDFFSTPFLADTTGKSVQTTLSPALAFKFQSNRTRTDIRRGSKSIAGGAESVLSTGGEIEAAAIPTLQLLAGKLGEVLTYDNESNILSYAPVIVSKEEYDVPGSSPVRTAYRYYDTFAEQSMHLMESITWSFKTTIRTQGSRQYGKGR